MNNPIALLSLEEIKQSCAEESERYRRQQTSDSASCMELLRRALILADQQAWNWVYQQYANQVARWIQSHLEFARYGENLEYFVNGAFARFAQAVTPEKFYQFKGLGTVLQYLKMCAMSTILDYQRMQRSTELVEFNEANVPATYTPPESIIEQQENARRLWQIIKLHLKSQEEQVAIESVFVFSMKPNQVVDKYPHLFTDVKRVYRVLENVLKRLERVPQLQQWFIENG